MDAVATFTSYELMDYSEFIVYTVILGMEALARPELRDKVINDYSHCLVSNCMNDFR